MQKLFGIPMTAIMGSLLAVVFIALLGFFYAAVRNPVLFRMGVRNIPRRRAQSIVIVFGLMISTLIITAAFTVGDSLSYSITQAVYDKGGPVDLKIETQSSSVEAGTGRPYIADGVVNAIEGQVGENPDLKTWLPVIDEPVPAGNPASRLNEPRVHLVGLDPQSIAAIGGLPAEAGGSVQVASLATGEAYINKTAADKLDAKAGDTVRVLFNNQQFPLTVKNVVKDRTITGWQDVQRDDNGGIVMSLAGVEAISGRSGGITDLWASTGADIRAGYTRGNRLFPIVKQVVASATVQSQLTGGGVGLKVHNSKHDGVDSAQLFGSGITAFFVTIGLFSIAAGMMLIFLIFVMLAAERRAEMGMARAVGIQRSGLVQSFLAEGMVYNLLASVVGVVLGIAVAFGLVWFVTHVIFTGKYELPLAGHVTVTSLVVSYCLGVALTFTTVVISAYKATRMNIVAAIRDLPEESGPASERRRFNGKLLLSSVARLFGSVAVLSVLSAGAKMGIIALPIFLVGLGLLIVACLPVTRSPLGIAWRTIAGGFVGTIWAILGASRAFGWSWTTIWSRYCVLAGGLAIWASHAAHSLFLFTMGGSLVLLGLALVARVRGVSGRLAFSLMSGVLIVFWLMPTNLFKQLFGGLYGPDSGGPEMFFLSGIMLVVATTLLMVENGEAFAHLVNRAGGRLGSLRPSLVTAIAYPMSSKLRTGMTLAMFSLIIFSITVMSTINSNFTNMLLTKDATGGWDVTASTNLNNPVPDLKSALAQAGVDTSKLTAVGATTPIQGLSDVRNASDTTWARYGIVAADPGFLDASTMKLQAHLKSDSSGAAWKELQQQPGTAIIDAQATNGNNGGGNDAPNFTLKGVGPTTTLLDHPFAIEVRNAAGEVKQLQVIGIINQVVANTGFSIFTSGETYQQTLGAKPAFTQFAIRLAPGTDDKAVAKQIKANLAGFGVQASAVRSDLADQQSQIRGFSYLFEGFMGLGLVVGIAAVAVIAARTVVERRQQIGMLRAVGYRRSQVALSFALETSFIALFGLLAGVITASILSYNLFTGGTFGDTSGAGFQLPYLQIGLFAGVAYVASLAMTYFPSRKAASLPIAEALRYE